MPKLDLIRAQRIKASGGELVALKGQGFSWAYVPQGGGTEGWATVASVTGSPDVLDYTDIDGINWRAWRFLANGSITFGVAGDVEYLCVAGGGGGGQDNFGGGGGGAGGMLEGASAVTDTTYAITVGAGGYGANTAEYVGQMGQPGGNSVIAGIATAIGGGPGIAPYISDQTYGGSGGGARAGSSPGIGTPGQGHDGGWGVDSNGRAGGGGGGAGEPGYDALPGGFSGAGGDGLSSAITGTATYYAGGGGGGRGDTAAAGGLGGGGAGALGSNLGADGVNGLGGGGGGSRYAAAGDGGSGVVIIRTRI